MCFSKVENDYASNFNFHILYVLARIVFIARKKKIAGTIWRPPIKSLSLFLCVHRKTHWKQKTQSKSNITVALCWENGREKTPHCRTMPRKRPGKNTSHSKNGHFAKAIAKQNGQWWFTLGRNFKDPKAYKKRLCNHITVQSNLP